MTILILLSTGLIGLLVFDGLVDEYGIAAVGNTIIVDASGHGNYTTIQDAINNSSTGDTIRVWEGVYQENIIVNKSVSLIGNGSAFTSIYGGSNQVIINIMVDRVNITGFSVTRVLSSWSYSGIWLNKVKHCNITDNICSNNKYGIYFDSSSNNSVCNNTCSNNMEDGIYLQESWNNTLVNNNCSNNYDGIYLLYSSNNTFENNTCSNNGYRGIYLLYSDNTTIINNTILKNDIGICNVYSQNNTLLNNNCSDNYDHGIWLDGSSYCNVNNNICLDNDGVGIVIYLYSLNISVINNNCLNNYIGLYVIYSNFNKIKNNICNSSNFTGMYYYYSSWNIIENNTCNSNQNGISFYGEGLPWRSEHNIIANNTCSYNQKGINLDYWSANNTIVNNNCSYNEDGIYLINSSDNNQVAYNNCSFNNNGIYIENSARNKINNNYCSNSSYGLITRETHNNTIHNNTCLTTSKCIYIIDSRSNKIRNNTCYSEFSDGIAILVSNGNTIENNKCNSKNWGSGIYLGNSQFNSVINNTSNLNYINGIYLDSSSDSNIIENNICNNNAYNGIYLLYSNSNIIDNNTFSSNTLSGIYLFSAISNTIANNSCEKNKHGIELWYSDSNKITKNGFMYNRKGIIITYYCDNNDIFENQISFNSKTGLELDFECNYNYLFHNLIISNAKQAIDNSTNFWNNSYYEGNYWSDYEGLDNGDNDRIPNDGIGDTDIPHLGLDYYPFMNSYGWLVPRPPLLSDPGEFDFDGEYILSWTKSTNVDGYILEEDDNYFFKSPTVLYQGADLLYKVTGKMDGTYYYRIKSYNENSESVWSNIVDITVDTPPGVPKNLQVRVWLAGNALNISWDKTDSDVSNYQLYVRTFTEEYLLANLSQSQLTYNHTGLTDGIRYYYKLRIFDHLNRTSGFCNEVSGIPADSIPPSAPAGLRVFERTYDSIKLTWIKPLYEDVKGYNIYRSNISNPEHWGLPINDDALILDIFYNDTRLDEGTTYYYVVTAVDEVPNESPYSQYISGKTYLFTDYPQPPEINNPQPDIYIPEDSCDSTSINLLHWFKDVNGDALTFHCGGKKFINVTIYQSNGTVVLRPYKDWSGLEMLVFYVSDGRFNFSDNITITVIPVNDLPGPINILSPEDGVEIENGTPIDLQASCDDPDLPYGDRLVFCWRSSLTGELGGGKSISNIFLSVGEHEISVMVVDKSGASANATINISVTKELSQSGKRDDLNSMFILGFGISIFIIILVIIILFFFIRFRRKRDLELQPTKSGKKKIPRAKYKPHHKVPKKAVTRIESDTNIGDEDEVDLLKEE